MEIKSEQKFNEVKVTDIDIAFPGDLQTFTLRDGVDSYDINYRDILTMRLAGGELKFQLDLAHWWAIRPRTIRVASPAAQPEQSAGGVPPANTGNTVR